MTDLTPVSSFDNVPQLETNTLALGGTGGPMNSQAQALLNRSQFNKDTNDTQQVDIDAASLFISNLQNKILSAQGSNLVGARRSYLNNNIGAAQRTQSNVLNDLPVFVTEWAGIDKTGATDISSALQDFIDNIASISVSGAIIQFPEGTYKFQNIDLPGVGDWIIRGNGARRTKFMLNSDNNALFNFDDLYAFTHKTFTGVGFYGGTTTNGRGIQGVRLRELEVLDCHFEHLAYNLLIDRARGILIDNITCRNSGCWFFHSTNDDDYIQNIMISNVIDPVGTDIFGLYGLTEAWHFKDVVNANMVNVSYSGLAGTTRFIHIIGKTEGVFGYDVICGFPSVGIIYSPFTYAGTTIIGTIRPQYTGFTNVGLDQPAVSSLSVDGDYHFFTGCWMANGTTRSNTGPGVEVKANSKGIRITDTYIAWHQLDGIVIANGALDVQLRGCMFTMNNGSGGANFDIRDQSDYGQTLIRDCSPTATVFSSNGRVVAGNTSLAVHANVTGATSNTSAGGIDDLRTFTIPAGSLKVGQRVRMRAWGTSAANVNSKTVRMNFGAGAMGGITSTTSAAFWTMTAEVWITGAATQNTDRTGIFGGTTNNQQTDLTEAISGAIIAKVTGQGVAAGDVTCKGFTVEVVS